jgi:hypothetical protein
MSSLVLASVALLAVLVVLNLALTLAMVRRLRDLQAGTTPSPHLPEVGMRPGELLARSADGDGFDAMTFGRQSNGRGLLAVVSPGCASCRQLLDALESFDADTARTVVVVGDGSHPETRGLLEAASRVARSGLVSETQLLSCLGPVDAFPTLLRVEDGRVTAAGHRLNDVLVSERG